MKLFIRILLLAVPLLAGTLLQAQQFTNYTTADGLPSNNVNGVAIDGNNIKWFATQEGVARFDDAVWTTYTTANGLIDNYVNCIAVDVNNVIWAGTDYGISKFDGTTWISYTHANGLIDDMVNFVAGAPDGSVWIGTLSGLSRLSGSVWTNYTTTNGLPADLISYIKADGTGNVWIGTWLGGLSKFNGTTFTNFTTADSLPDNNVTAIALGSNDTKWIGTYYGVAVFNSQDQWVATYRQAEGLYNNFIHDIAMDPRGTMWFALYDIYVQDAGLTMKNATGWTSYTTVNGLPNSQVKRIAIDTANNIWIATAAGVSMLEDVAEGVGEAGPAGVRVYPNPATTEIHLEGLPDPGQATLMTVHGKQVTDFQLSRGSNTLSLDGLAPGIYLLRCATAKGVENRKIVIR